MLAIRHICRRLLAGISAEVDRNGGFWEAGQNSVAAPARLSSGSTIGEPGSQSDQFLEPGGRMIVTTVVSGHKGALLRLTEIEATVLDRKTVTDRNGSAGSSACSASRSASRPAGHLAIRLKGQMPPRRR
jgi:hypothetical protein